MSRPQSSSRTRPASRASPKKATSAAEAEQKEQIKQAANQIEYDTSSDTAQTLRASISMIQAQIAQERALQNVAMNEKKYIIDQTSLAQAEKEKLTHDLRDLLQEKEEATVNHSIELNVYKTKLTALLSDQMSELNSESIDQMKSLLHNDLSFLLTAEREEKSEFSRLLVYARELESSHADLISAFKLSHEREIMSMRQHYELQQSYLRANYSKLMKTKRDEIEAQKKAEITTLEAKKLSATAQVLENNKREIDELKKYFSDLIHSHLDTIKNLREEVGDMKKKEASLTSRINYMKKCNDQLNAPLHEKTQLLAALQQKQQDYVKEKKSIKEWNAQLQSVNQSINQLKWKREILLQQMAILKSERSGIQSLNQRSKFDMLQKASFVQMIENSQTALYKSEMEKLTVGINEILLASEIDPQSVGLIQGGLEELLTEKNKLIMRLEDEIHEWRTRYTQAREEYQKEMKFYDVPVTELGFDIKTTL